MGTSFRLRAATWLVPALLAVAALGAATASAQPFGPPATVFGSVTDSEGPVPAGLDVEAYIGDQVCGRGKTEYTGEGDARVTVYWADVHSAEQTPGCGTDGAEIRIRIGDRFAPQVGTWRAGPVQVDVTFGDATPAPIPTFTPTPTRTPTPVPTAAGTPIPTEDTGGQGEGEGDDETATIPAGSPGAGSPTSLRGGVTSGEEGNGGAGSTSGGGDDGGFPVWAVVVLVLGAIAAVGGGIGYAMARSRNEPEDELYPLTEDE